MHYRTFERLACGVIVAAILIGKNSAAIGAVIFGAPPYDPVTHTGYDGNGEENHVVGEGISVGIAEKSVLGVDMGRRAVRWDAAGGAAELGNIGTKANGYTNTTVTTINALGTAVGIADKYISDVDKGTRPVRWDATTTTATELGNLGTDTTGVASAWINALNNANQAVGYASKYDPVGMYFAGHAVRWEASGAATELGNLGVSDTGFWHSEAYDINDAGITVGSAYKYESGLDLGVSAVRWNAAGVATGLDSLGSMGGVVYGRAVAVNSIGTTVGFAEKVESGTSKGDRAVRWDASTSTPIELGNLGTDSSGVAYSEATDVNDSNIAVGSAYKYQSGSNKGQRAVRWDSSGLVTELGILGTDSSGKTQGNVYAINNAGIAVGYTVLYDLAHHELGKRAVAWGPNGAAIQLDTLLQPNSGWVNLLEARAISDGGWISGAGTFDPGGGRTPYRRMFLMQIPESRALTLLAIGGLSLVLYRFRIK
jgi:hypothetical protein